MWVCVRERERERERVRGRERGREGGREGEGSFGFAKEILAIITKWIKISLNGSRLQCILIIPAKESVSRS